MTKFIIISKNMEIQLRSQY